MLKDSISQPSSRRKACHSGVACLLAVAVFERCSSTSLAFFGFSKLLRPTSSIPRPGFVLALCDDGVGSLLEPAFPRLELSALKALELLAVSGAGSLLELAFSRLKLFALKALELLAVSGAKGRISGTK